MVAIPDFAAGAMENWGLVTYRETALLFDPDESSSVRKQRVAIVVAHEIAHMWFGNLVTMEWWTQLWLNEGFATWMQYFAVDHVFPEWDIWEHFISDDYCFALEDDALRTTHPIEVPINHPDEIGQNFDAISYNKGAAIIRMIHDYIGAEAFREGLQIYLTRHQYANAVTENLWQAFEDSSGEPVSEIMRSWTEQLGYPLVSIKQTDEDRIEMTQRRFLSSGAALTDEEEEQVWHIILPFLTDIDNPDTTRAPVILERKEAVSLSGCLEGSWIKFNPGQVTFARVNYPPQLWEALKLAIVRHDLSAIDCVGVVSDLYVLAGAGELSTTQLLSMLEAYKDERSYIVWSKVLDCLKGISKLLPDEGEVRKNFNVFARNLLYSIVHRKGWETDPEETHADILLRPKILGAYGHYDHQATISEAQRRFGAFVFGKESLDPELRSMVYTLVARNGGDDIFDILVKCYRKTESNEEQVYFLEALAQLREGNTFRKALEFLLSDDVRSQDVFKFISAISSHSTRELFWEFVKANWGEFNKRFGENFMLMERIIKYSTGEFSSEKMAIDVEAFFKEHPVPRASRSIDQSVESIRSQANWIGRDGESIAQWLAERTS